MKRKIGFVGGTGMIGSHLLEAWHKRFECLQLIRHRPINESTDTAWAGVQVLGDMDEFLERCDVIFYLGHTGNPYIAEENFPSGFASNLRDIEDFIAATKRVVAKGRVPLVVYASSGGTVYGDVDPSRGPIKESNETHPTSAYGLQKLFAENLLSFGAHRIGYNLIVLRLSNVYGVPLSVLRKQGLIGTWLSLVRNQLPIPLYSSRETVRDYLHLSDLQACLELLLEKQSNQTVDVYNVATSTGINIDELLVMMREVTGQRITVDESHLTMTRFYPKWNVLDHSKIACELGWQPRVDVRQGMQTLWNELLASETKHQGS